MERDFRRDWYDVQAHRSDNVAHVGIRRFPWLKPAAGAQGGNFPKLDVAAGQRPPLHGQVDMVPGNRRQALRGVHPEYEDVGITSCWFIRQIRRCLLCPSGALFPHELFGAGGFVGWISAAQSTDSEPISRTRWITARPGRHAEATQMPCAPHSPYPRAKTMVMLSQTQPA